MRQRVYLKALGMLAALATVPLVGLAADRAAPPSQDVAIQLFQFRPGQSVVPRGTRVVWTNRDDITHTVTSGTPDRRDGRFDAPLAGQGATAGVEFTEPGIYPYFCDRHRSMRGEIRVD